MKSAIERERIRPLLDTGVREGGLVVYWMQASQRVSDNLALNYAFDAAHALGRPLLVVFGLTDDYPEANLRHYRFMLEGLCRVASELADLRIGFAVRRGAPHEAVTALAFEPSLIVTDAGYLWEQRSWRKELIKSVECRVVQVEDNVVVPVRVASEKEEYAAYTIRKKILKHRDRFLVSPDSLREADMSSLGLAGEAFGDDAVDLSSGAENVCSTLELDESVTPSNAFRGGTDHARAALGEFISGKLDRYHEERSDPSLHVQSNMSPYLHFGQISPREIAIAVRDSGAAEEATEAYLEELIVRRELAVNFVYYNRDYRHYDSLPGWALETLEEHRGDPREQLYSRKTLEAGETDDPYWNAAMREMRITGSMHNYMRMYWGKRFLEWHEEPREAFTCALAINNKYFLDGRDANSFAGVAWCFGKHDRPWQERPVFGKIRYMNANGLKRKFDIEEYVRWTESLDPQ